MKYETQRTTRTKGKQMNATYQPAQIILQQLGGSNRLQAMINATNFLSCDEGKTLRFKFSGCKTRNVCSITLEANDTYTVKFYKLRGTNCPLISEHEMVYADTLRQVFEMNTDLLLSL